MITSNHNNFYKNTHNHFEFLTQSGELKVLCTLEVTSKLEKDLIKDLSCCVCYKLYEETLKTRKCEHVVCANCYLNLSNKNCPECREDLSLEGKNLFEPPSLIENTAINNVKTNCRVIKQEMNEETKSAAKTQNFYYEISSTQKKLNKSKIEQDNTASSQSHSYNTREGSIVPPDTSNMHDFLQDITFFIGSPNSDTTQS